MQKLVILLLLLVLVPATAQPSSELAIGKELPSFLALDSRGVERELAHYSGPKGTLLVIFRSADWWPFCKEQLVQLQESLPLFESQGLSIVGLSYDSPEILQDFQKRKAIDFPLLADPNSRALEKLGLVNHQATGMSEGVAHPGVILLDREGKIQDMIFEESYRTRATPGSLLAKFFPREQGLSDSSQSTGKDGYFLAQSGTEGVMGSQWELFVTFRLPTNHHLYAPNDKGYVPLKLSFEKQDNFEIGEVQYPDSEVLELPAIQERVPVYTGTVQVRVPVTVASTERIKKLKKAFSTKLEATLEYQICTDKNCLLPQSVPVEWDAKIKPLDRRRVQKSYQH